MSGLEAAVVGLGVAAQGVREPSTGKSVRIVFLLLSPTHPPEVHVRLLGRISKLAQHHLLRQELANTSNAEEAARILEEHMVALIVLPLFEQIKGLAQEILEMNQANMSEADDAARSQAASAQRRMTIAILSCAVVAILFSLLAQRWILDPIRRLIDSANEIRRGNLELVLNADSRDEIGHLSRSVQRHGRGPAAHPAQRSPRPHAHPPGRQ